MKIPNITQIFFLIICFSQVHFSQGTSAPIIRSPDEETRKAEEIRRRYEEINNRLGQKDKNGMIPDRTSVNSPTSLYKGKDKENKALRQQFEATKHLLKLDKESHNLYKNLIQRNKMKLIRLHEDKNCNFEIIISVLDSERCSNVVPIFGNGSYYSFPLETHYYIQPIYIRADATSTLVTGTPKLGFTGMGNWWNIHFNDGIIESNKGLIIDISNEVGQTELENFSLKSPLLTSLKNYGNEKTIVSIKFEKDKITTNTKEESENKDYPKSARMVVGNTYLVHLFATENITIRTRKNGKVEKNITNKPSATYVLKILAQELDKSLIILVKNSMMSNK